MLKALAFFSFKFTYTNGSIRWLKSVFIMSISVVESKYSKQNWGGREGETSEASARVSFITEDSVTVWFMNILKCSYLSMFTTV